jgi:hypothetical protein
VDKTIYKVDKTIISLKTTNICAFCPLKSPPFDIHQGYKEKGEGEKPSPKKAITYLTKFPDFAFSISIFVFKVYTTGRLMAVDMVRFFSIFFAAIFG